MYWGPVSGQSLQVANTSFLICHELTVIAACVEAKLVFDIL